MAKTKFGSSVFGANFIVVNVTLFGLLFTGAHGQCVPFPEIDEANYDRNYSHINDADRRPLGFFRATVPFNDPETQDPCFSVDNVNARSVEVMFETIPSMTLCLRDQSGTRRCEQGRFQECLGASASTMQFTFFCEVSEGCSESDVNFWVRITRGPPQEEDPEGMWCQWRDNNYPQSLQTLPPAFTPPPTTPTPVGGSTAITSSITMVIGAVLTLLGLHVSEL